MTGLCGCGRAREGKPHDLWQTLGGKLTKTIETKHSEKIHSRKNMVVS